MKTFTFRYNPIASPQDLFSRLTKAAKSHDPDFEQSEALSNSVQSLLSTMTAGRIQLFYVIANQKPESMYQLAQLLERDPSNVIRDVKVLEGLKLVRLQTEKDGGRERSRPVALYDRLVFDFGKANLSGKKAKRKRVAS